VQRDALPSTFPPPPAGLASEVEGELAWLLAAARSGETVTPMAVVPVAVETDFYRLSNLPEQLRRLFDGVVSDDPDEDDIDERAPLAVALVLAHALLDEVVEALYQASAGLPERLQVRREGHAGVSAWRGRDALLALKRTWAEDWSGERVMARLRAGRGLAPEARPILVHDAALAPAPDLVGLGPHDQALRAWRDPAGRLGRLARGDP
jgi:hypothetical protein